MTGRNTTNPKHDEMLDEDKVIASITKGLTFHDRVLVGPGDDCAVLSHPDSRSVITTDVLVENIHFRRDWMTPREIGERAAVQNMADIAAMGARQHAAVIAVTVPSNIRGNELTEITQGFSDAFAQHGGALVGGDISSGPTLSLAVTMVGDLEGRKPILRTQAQPGDAVIIAGDLGLSRLGLEILMRGIKKQQVADSLHTVFDDAVMNYKTPRSPIDSGVIAGKSGVHAMMDVSDGLSRDVAKIARCSGVTIDLSAAQLASFVDSLRDMCDMIGIDPWEMVLNGGEDHSLVATCTADAIPETFSQIGRVLPARADSSTVHCGDSAGACSVLSLDGEIITPRGWDHFHHDDDGNHKDRR